MDRVNRIFVRASGLGLRHVSWAVLAVLVACGHPSGLEEIAPEARLVSIEVATPDLETSKRFEETMAYARETNLHERSIGEVVTAVGERFVGAPYKAGTLDQGKEEELVCRLDAFDCVTFVESVLAMARGIRQQDYRFATWTGHVRDVRYRDGRVDGYCSRLHYFSEWIADNERRGTVEDVTRAIGGVQLEKRLNYMSRRRADYARLAHDDGLLDCIREREDQLRNLEIFYVPANRVREAYGLLRAGDVVAMATRIDGLDVSHTGFVYDFGDGTKGLLHASSRGSVEVSRDLQSYVRGVASQIGIIVARPLEPPRR